MTPRLASLNLFAVALCGLWGRDASACSQEACPPSVLVPASLPDTTRMIPANLPALVWGIARLERAPTASDLRLVREGAMPAEVATALSPFAMHDSVQLIRPAEPWAVGARYTLTANTFCSAASGSMEGAVTTSFLVGPEVPFPATLGTLSMGALQQQETVVPPDSFDGTCGTTAVVASRAPSLALSSDAASWSSLLLVQFLVDGRPRGFVRTGDGATVPTRNFYAGPDQLPYVVCGTPSPAETFAITPGPHRFQFRATVPGSDLALLSNEVEADITCAPTPADAGAPADVPEAARDASVSTDAPAPATDAPRAEDVADGATVTPMMNGGGCSAARPGRGGRILALLSLLALARGRRRAKRSPRG